MSAETDQLYIQALHTGNEQVLHDIYRQYLPRILTLVRNSGGSADDARDVFQEALIVIYEKSRAGSFQLTSSFFTLLYGICRNIWGNRLQKKDRRTVTLPDDPKLMIDSSWEPFLLEEERNQVLWDSFKRLGEDCRRLLQLFFEKTDMETIARLMGFSSVGYAKKRKFQCKERLLELIRADARYAELKA